MFPTPKNFAELLSQSLLPQEVKEVILKKLNTLSSEQINAIFNVLEQEKNKIEEAKSQFESKLSLAEMKLENELNQL